MNTEALRTNVSDAIRFWEPLRIAYNGVLAGIVVLCFVRGYPGSKAMVTFDSFLLFFVLAVLANVAYCAVYVVDVFVQASAYRELWRRVRWILFAVGLVFASILTRFWSIGMFVLPSK